MLPGADMVVEAVCHGTLGDEPEKYGSLSSPPTEAEAPVNRRVEN